MSIIFDIETGPDEDRFSRFMKPFEPPEPPGDFDPTTVKCGNIGGPDSDKGKKKIADAKAKHELEVQNYESLVKQERIKHESEQRSRAGLDPSVGCVLAIRYLNTFVRKAEIVGDRVDEVAMINDFWNRVKQARVENNRFVGHFIHDFDLPFLMRRSWLLKIEVPDFVIDKHRRYFDPMFIDTFKVWQCGAYRCEPGSATLDRLSQLFGDKGKEGASGADFAKLWESDREAAKRYLMGDLRQTVKVAEGLGVL